MDKAKFTTCVKPSKFIQKQLQDDESYRDAFHYMLQEIETCPKMELHDYFPREYNSHRGAKRRSRIRHQTFDPRLSDFRDFLAHVGPCPDPTSREWSLDCFDPTKGYTLNNVRWVPKLIQTQNRRVTKWHQLPDGRKLTTKQLADYLHQPYQTIYKALSRRNKVEYLLERYEQGTGLQSWKFPTELSHLLEPQYRKRRFKPQSRIEWYIRYLQEMLKDCSTSSPDLTPDHKQAVSAWLEATQKEYHALFMLEQKKKAMRIEALTGIPLATSKGNDPFSEIDFDSML